MPLRWELKASATGPGYAILTVYGWQQEAGNLALSTLELSVQRNQDGRYLDESGEWTTHPVWHDVSALKAGEPPLNQAPLNQAPLSSEFGPWLVDPLMRNPQVAYMLELRGPDHKDKGVLRMIGQILSSQAAGNSVRQDARFRHAATPPPSPSPAPAPAPIIDVAAPVRKAEPSPAAVTPEVLAEASSSLPSMPFHQPLAPSSLMAPDAPVLAETKRSKLPLILTAVAALLILGGAAAWWFLPRDVLSALGAGMAGAAADVQGPCGSTAMEATTNDLEFVQACVQASPSSEQVLATIEAAKDAHRCNIVQRLYAHKAQAGDGRIAFAYAREYDPDTFSGGCVKSADAETATYWYEIAIANDPGNTEAKQRLEQLGK